MNQSWFIKIATLGPIGYLPASGSFATLVTLPLIFYMQKYVPHYYGIITLSMIAAALYCIHKALRSFAEQDPCAIVLDELVGALVVFYTVPLTIPTALFGFIFFRFFDISKWFIVGYAERLPGTWGVVADDVAAGILALAVLKISMYWFF